ncbi:uncharacterized protein [Arachis hypogaea]|uniref:uncharacterized protein isoform X5 n=1 Tax=Arachis hypogaea TaxID=3818 RepID=UPI003B215B84
MHIGLARHKIQETPKETEEIVQNLMQDEDLVPADSSDEFNPSIHCRRPWFSSPCRAQSCGVAVLVVVPKSVSIVVVIGCKKTSLSPRRALSLSPFSLCPRPRPSSLTVKTIPSTDVY